MHSNISREQGETRKYETKHSYTYDTFQNKQEATWQRFLVIVSNVVKLRKIDKTTFRRFDLRIFVTNPTNC